MALEPETVRLLNQVRAEQAVYGEPPQPPADEADLTALIERAHAMLGLAPPEAYLDVLRREDGLNHNGLFLYASRDGAATGNPEITLPGLVEANLLWREAPDLRLYLIFGDGNLDLYGRDLETGDFVVVDRVPGNVIAAYGTFDALVAAVIRSHL